MLQRVWSEVGFVGIPPLAPPPSPSSLPRNRHPPPSPSLDPTAAAAAAAAEDAALGGDADVIGDGLNAQTAVDGDAAADAAADVAAKPRAGRRLSMLSIDLKVCCDV